jgi:hypothetical protein
MALIAVINLPVAAMFAWIALNPHHTHGSCDGRRRRLTCLFFKTVFEALPPYAENVFGGMMFLLFVGVIAVLLRESLNRQPLLTLSPMGIKGRLALSTPWFVKWEDVRSIDRQGYGVQIKANHAAPVPWWFRRRKDGYTLGIANKDVGMSSEELLDQILRYKSSLTSGRNDQAGLR